MKTLLQLRSEIKNDLLKSVSVTGNTYSSDFIDERINATVSNICWGTVVNPANPQQFITKTNLRFLERSKIYGVMPVSSLSSQAIIEWSAISLNNGVNVTNDSDRYSSFKNVYQDVTDNNLPISFGNASNNHAKVAVMFKPHKARLQSIDVKKRNTSWNPITSIVYVDLCTNNGWVPWDIVAQDTISATDYNLIPNLGKYRLNFNVTLNPDNVYFLVFYTSTDVVTNWPFIEAWYTSSNTVTSKKYKIDGFTYKLPLHTLEYTGSVWRSYNNDTNYVLPIIDFNYYSSLWIDGNMVNYVTYSNVDTEQNFINFPHKAWSKVHYAYELPSDYGFLTKVTYDSKYEIQGVDYRKLYQSTSLWEPRMNLPTTYDNNSYRYGMLPFYSLYTDRLMLLVNGDKNKDILVQYQAKHPYLYNDNDTTLIPDNYVGAITYLAASDILSLRWEPDKAIELWQKGYSYALALVKQEGYKNKEMLFNTRVRSVSDSFLNI